MHYIARKVAPPEGSYFLLGPRGTGKSTWLLHHYPDAVRVDFLRGSGTSLHWIPRAHKGRRGGNAARLYSHTGRNSKSPTLAS